jgi:ribosomal-protein-alanine N-acetyltransferase
MQTHLNNYVYIDNLESERLVTRKLTLDDVDGWSSFFEDEEAVKFLPDRGFNSTKERARNWIDRQLARYAEQRYGLHALFNKKSNAFVGQCGLILQVVDGEPQLEVGYHIFKKHWGQGYAPEAAKLFIDFAFEYNQAASVISIISVGNIKSQRVAQKNGLAKVRQTRWSDLDVFIYLIDK